MIALWLAVRNRASSRALPVDADGARVRETLHAEIAVTAGRRSERAPVVDEGQHAGCLRGRHDVHAGLRRPCKVRDTQSADG